MSQGNPNQLPKENIPANQSEENADENAKKNADSNVSVLPSNHLPYDPEENVKEGSHKRVLDFTQI